MITLDEISGRVKTMLEEHKKEAYMSYDLARIRTDAPVTLDIEQARTDSIDLPKVTALIQSARIPGFGSEIGNINE